MQYKKGETVAFLVPFQNANVRIERGEIGVIRSEYIPPYYCIVAKGVLWLALPSEITTHKQEEQNG